MIFQKKPQVSASPSEAFALYLRGLDARIDGDQEGALQFLTRAVTLDSDLTDGYYQLAKLFLGRREFARAQKILRDLLLRPAMPVEFRRRVENRLVEAYIAGGALKEARELAEFCQKKDSEDLALRQSLVAILERQGEFEAARKHWNFCAGKRNIPAAPRLALYRVEMARQQKEDAARKARKLLQQALRLDERCAPAYIELARQYRREGDTTRVLETWDRLLEKVPAKSVLVFREMEDYLFEIHQYDVILLIYQRLSRREGVQRAAVLAALARQYHKMGRTEAAVETILQLAGEVHDDTRLLKELITYYLECDKSARILDRIEHLIRERGRSGAFVCSICAAAAEEPLWRCPECSSWETYQPRS